MKTLIFQIISNYIKLFQIAFSTNIDLNWLYLNEI